MKQNIRIDIGPKGFASGVTTLHTSGSTDKLLKISYPKNFGESISNINIELIRDTVTSDESIIAGGKEIRVWHNTGAVGNTDAERVFRGYIMDKVDMGDRITISAADLFVESLFTVVSDTSHDYETATNISTILTDLCTHAGLTASISGTPDPLQITKFYSKEQVVFERISYLLNLIGFYAYYDPTTTQTIKIQPKSAGSLQTFDGTNIISKPDWKFDTKDLINEVVVIAGSNNVANKTSTFTGDGGSLYTNTSASISPYLPTPNIVLENLTVSGSSYGEWPKNYYKMTAGSADNSTGIIFTRVGHYPAVAETVTITYSYQTASSSSAVTSNATSKSNYITRQKIIRKPDTTESTDATNWAANLVGNGSIGSFWEAPVQEVSFTVDDTILYPVLGSKADVTDPYTAKAITYIANFGIVQSIEQQWPYPGINIVVSTKPLKDPMQQTSVENSLRQTQLEFKKIDPTSLLRKNGTTPMISTSGYWDIGGTQLTNLRFENSTISPENLDTGGVFFDSSGGAGKGALKINYGTSASPTWTEVGGFDNWVDPKLYLNTAQTAWIEMNGNVLEFHIPGGKWRVVPE